MNAGQKPLAIVLSGGRGNRFNGADKGLQAYQGKPLIQHVIENLRPQVGKIIISINRNQAAYQCFDAEVVTDDNREYQGPLAGISAAIDYSRENNIDAQHLLISSCDSPNLPNDYVVKLQQHLTASDHLVAIVNDGQRNQNLHCLIDHSACESLQAFYQTGGRAMHRWFTSIGVLAVDFSAQAECFLNINSPEQLQPL